MGLRNGKEYLAGLKDGRQIIYNGEAISDVTSEPGFANTAQAISEFYDFQSRPDMQETMTYKTEEGERVGLAFIEPRSKEDIRRRAAAYTAWAELTCGLIGRSPDYMNTVMMGVGAGKSSFGIKEQQFGKNAYDTYLKARQQDLCMTHTFIHPLVDRTKKPLENPAMLRVIRETSEGAVVTGARAVATLAPFSDSNLSLQINPPKLEKGEEDFAISFTLPINASGLRWICRDLYSQQESKFNSPLASKFDEMDCIAIFEECLIPWENIFAYKDINIHNQQAAILRLTSTAAHQVLIKNIAKTRFMFGLAHLLAESSQSNKQTNVQERLGDFAIYLQNLESLAIAAVEGAIRDKNNGLWYPNPSSLLVSLRLYPEYYQTMINHLMQLGSSGYVSSPQQQTIEVLGDAIENYFRGATSAMKEKVALFRMAWDLVGSSWGGRQLLYERFFFGDSQAWKAQMYNMIDKTEAISMVQKLLNSSMSATEKPKPTSITKPTLPAEIKSPASETTSLASAPQLATTTSQTVQPSATLPTPALQIPTCDDHLIWDVYLSMFHYPTLVVADKMGIFPFLAVTPSTPDELAKRYSFSLHAMEAFLGVLSSLGFLVQHQGHFYLTDVSRNFLLPKSEFYWGGMLRLGWATPSLSPAKLFETLRKQPTSAGKLANMWEQSEMTLQQDKIFTNAMHSHSFPAAIGVARRGNFSNVKRLLDIGGGSGCFCIAIALYHEQMRLTIMERPNVCKAATEYIEKYQLQDRVDTLAIDMFNDPWPTGYDAMLLSNVFHDWNTENCILLGKRSFDALPSGGTIYVHEMLLDDTKDGPLAAASFSLNMVLITNGKQFTAQEITDLLTECGFRDVSITPTYAYYSLISAKKP